MVAKRPSPTLNHCLSFHPEVEVEQEVSGRRPDLRTPLTTEGCALEGISLKSCNLTTDQHISYMSLATYLRSPRPTGHAGIEPDTLLVLGESSQGDFELDRSTLRMLNV
jgi:hypothetical protein